MTWWAKHQVLVRSFLPGPWETSLPSVQVASSSGKQTPQMSPPNREVRRSGSRASHSPSSLGRTQPDTELGTETGAEDCGRCV